MGNKVIKSEHKDVVSALGEMVKSASEDVQNDADRIDEALFFY